MIYVDSSVPLLALMKQIGGSEAVHGAVGI